MRTMRAQRSGWMVLVTLLVLVFGVPSSPSSSLPGVLSVRSACSSAVELVEGDTINIAVLLWLDGVPQGVFNGDLSATKNTATPGLNRMLYLPYLLGQTAAAADAARCRRMDSEGREERRQHGNDASTNRCPLQMEHPRFDVHRECLALCVSVLLRRMPPSYSLCVVFCADALCCLQASSCT
jgi:hypothetical protein